MPGITGHAPRTGWRGHGPRARSAAKFDSGYLLGPDSKPTPGVPHGTVREFLLADSVHYPRHEHKWWLYIPAQYDGVHPVALMVFQDGGSWEGAAGPWQVPIVLDNLIQKKELPTMAAVFVDSGVARETKVSAGGSPSAAVMPTRTS